MLVNNIEDTIKSLYENRGVKITAKKVDENTIKLEGITPTYYLKQLALETAMKTARGLLITINIQDVKVVPNLTLLETDHDS